MTRAIAALCAASIALACGLEPSPARAMVPEEKELLDLNGMVHAGFGLARYRGAGPLAGVQELPWDFSLRLLADGVAGNWRVKANLLESVRTASLFAERSGREVVGVERSSLFTWDQDDKGGSRAGLVLDAGAVTWGSDRTDLTLGRQPVQLSVASYFTPNDFFAPFAAQQFYRVYKPGVDGLRYERRLGDLAQLTLLGVFGYRGDPATENGWSRAPEWERTSLLGRYVWSEEGLEWGGLAGVVREKAVIGGSVQGELTDWLGIRAEGHYRGRGGEGEPSGFRLSVGLEHRFANGLMLRFEEMVNTTGSSSRAEALQVLAAGGSDRWYSGRHSMAFSLGHEFSPLFTGEFLFLRDGTDASRILAFYLVYSLGNEAELAFQVSLPEGEGAGDPSRVSELGSQLFLAALEYRHYF